MLLVLNLYIIHPIHIKEGEFLRWSPSSAICGTTFHRGTRRRLRSSASVCPGARVVCLMSDASQRGSAALFLPASGRAGARAGPICAELRLRMRRAGRGELRAAAVRYSTRWLYHATFLGAEQRAVPLLPPGALLEQRRTHTSALRRLDQGRSLPRRRARAGRMPAGREARQASFLARRSARLVYLRALRRPRQRHPAAAVSAGDTTPVRRGRCPAGASARITRGRSGRPRVRLSLGARRRSPTRWKPRCSTGSARRRRSARGLPDCTGRMENPPRAAREA